MRAVVLSLCVSSIALAVPRDEVADLKAKQELLARLGQMIAADPKEPANYARRAEFYMGDGHYAEAIADWSRCMELDPKNAGYPQHRGMANFLAGKFTESVADFDKEIALDDKRATGHWMRGISLYYAGRYADGKKQFDAYQKTDRNDVENAVWHFLCAAKADGIDKARDGILKIGKDTRVPMMEVYELYKGKIKPDDVLAACGKGRPTEQEHNRRQFYAHLYLGIYADVQGDKKKAEEHLALAAGKYKIGHYMGEVARVHLEVLRAKKKE
jgi:lipoprotein NlpI